MVIIVGEPPATAVRFTSFTRTGRFRRERPLIVARVTSGLLYFESHHFWNSE